MARPTAASRPSLLALGVGLLSVLSGIATYAILTGLVPYNPTPAKLVALVLINLSLVLTLGAVLAVFRYQAGMIAVLGACSGLGVVYYLATGGVT